MKKTQESGGLHRRTFPRQERRNRRKMNCQRMANDVGTLLFGPDAVKMGDR
ncbi:MAG: hypothetical protein ACLTK0_05485 [Anaerovoracaceae bacterium]